MRTYFPLNLLIVTKLKTYFLRNATNFLDSELVSGAINLRFVPATALCRHLRNLTLFFWN